MKVYHGKTAQLKNYFIQNLKNKVVSLNFESPSPSCRVCSKKSVQIETNLASYKLGMIVKLIEKSFEGRNLPAFSINRNLNELYISDEPS